jgi:L-ascorbate metabolism protein UlaG (beta-lactamase superfamily)
VSPHATLDWLGCATFRLTLDRLVVFLDAYVDRAPGAPPTGLAAADIDRADWILVGHSHFDHLWGAERIARRTGATIVGSYETVRIMAEQGVPEQQLMPVSGGERVRLSETVTVAVFPSLHSCIWSQARFEQPDQVCLGDLGLSHQERLARLAALPARLANLGDELRAYLRASNQGDRGDGGALVYRVETPEGSLLYQDTCGYWTGLLRGLRADVAILAAAGRGNIDGEPVQGSLAGFIAGEVELLQPGRLILGHHDDWLPGFSIPTNAAPIRSAVAAVAPRVELAEMGYRAAYPLFAGLPEARPNLDLALQQRSMNEPSA